MTDERSRPGDSLRDDETPRATDNDVTPPHGNELRSEVTFGRTDRYTNVDDEERRASSRCRIRKPAATRASSADPRFFTLTGSDLSSRCEDAPILVGRACADVKARRTIGPLA